MASLSETVDRLTARKKVPVLDRLLDEVDALVAVHVGKTATSEPWSETWNRLYRLKRLSAALRKAGVKLRYE